MQEEIMELKSRLAEASMQAADLRAELKQRDIAQSQHVVEIELLRRQLDSVDDESVRQAEEWEEKTSGLTKNHVHAMDTHNKQVAQDVATLTEQWQNDVASRDLRIQEMESTASDMQTMVLPHDSSEHTSVQLFFGLRSSNFLRVDVPIHCCRWLRAAHRGQRTISEIRSKHARTRC